MYVYIIHKREVLLSLLALLSAYILLLFIGLAGPNVDKVNSIYASEIFRQDSITNRTIQHELLQSGPFQITTTTLSSYSQHLSLYLTFSLENEESSEAFHKQFQAHITMLGLSQSSNDNGIMNNVTGSPTVANGSAILSLYCGGRQCEPIRLAKLLSIDYEQYLITIRFRHLESVNDKYTIKDILFDFRSVNVSFTNLSIWFRFLFIMITFLIMCFYMHNLYRFPMIDWSLEQKWTSVHLILLILSNNPFYPLQFLLDSTLLRILEISLYTTLQCLVMLFWLCFFHRIRQSNRSIPKFYTPKLVIVGLIWITVNYTMSWSLKNQLSDPVFDEQANFDKSILLQVSLHFSLFLEHLLIFNISTLYIFVS